MNKDVIYIEPEDDITDIITKIENSKEKIVALVPPKKAGVFRSVVNIKLIAKAGVTSEKTIVLVTVDPSIIKLAAATKLPVTKDLQTAPSVPTADTDLEETVKEDLVEKSEENSEEDEEKSESKEDSEDEEDDKAEEDDDKDEKKSGKEKKKKEKSEKKSGNKLKNWFIDHKKTAIFGGVGGILLILVLIWAFLIAPAVNVFVSIKTDTNNFSEAVNFVKEQSQENIKENKIFIEERKIETVNEVSFEATGQKNRGEKATGTLIVSHSFFESGSVPVNQGTIFSIDGLEYVATETVPIGWAGWSGHTASDIKENVKSCSNAATAIDDEYCTIVREVKVEARNSGSAYNIPAKSGWSSVVNVDAYSNAPMTGGTDDIITVVQQSDVEKARNELGSSKEAENKTKLYESITDDNLIIESTFKQSTSAAVSTPAVDEEVKDVKPSLKTTTTTSVYVIDKIKLEELIREKVDLPDDKKIFEIRNVYIDGFREAEGGFAGKLKAVYFTGPRITESGLVERIMGKGIGDARREIKDIEGVSEVKMDPSVPWVMRVPNNSNRISMTFEIKDQNGEKIEEKSEQTTDEPNEQSTEKSDDKKKEGNN